MIARPGQSLRLMAQRRRRQAGLMFALTGAWLSTPFWLPWLWEGAMGRALDVPLWGWLVCLLPAAACFQQARLWWQQAQRAEEGANQAETVADRLIPLQNLGWQASYGVREPYSVGTTDILLVSPAGHGYAIDVKAHRVRVGSNGRQIYRVSPRSRSPFERDFVSLARRQAVNLKKRRRLISVTPVLTFTNGIVDVGQNPVAGVYVVAAKNLLDYLQQLEADHEMARASQESESGTEE
jgi:hypothetical protein